ncbi:MAG: hypothetical protein U9N86_18985 [Bacteroidota bacterium]|nr:hypothetical protein [Bacteroidota bacterium]
MIYLNSDIPRIDKLIPRIERFLSKDILEVSIDGKEIRGYRSPDAKSIWIRDYSDILRGARYFETDVKSVVQHFADTQAMNGRIFDYFTTHPEKLPCERENWTKYVRVPVEADVEYRFVKAAWLAFQACGDVEWLRSLLPHLERAIFYLMNDPQRWDKHNQLVKRPYTIDTWDFAYTNGKHPWLQFQIDKDTYWGIFHGDNSGLYEALQILSKVCELFDKTDKSKWYREKAASIKKTLNKICWNGQFYQHFKKNTPITIDNCDEDDQLSLSNPMSLNRGVGDPQKASAMLMEYQHRADAGAFFAPWFSIEPPFPNGSFGDEKLVAGAYINGGLFPLAGGELALLALENGFEKYGFHQIMIYENLTRNDESYLWYFPDGTPSTVETSTSPDATPTDGWGSTAFLMAIIQGLAGIIDQGQRFQNLKFCPRWVAAGSKRAEVEISYPAGNSSLKYTYQLKKSQMNFNLDGHFEELESHILIPDNCRVTEVKINGVSINFSRKEVNDSKYVDFKIFQPQSVHIEILFDTIF